MIELLSEKFPENNGKLCHENIPFAHLMAPDYWSKLTLFNVKEVYSLDYWVGGHQCDRMFKTFIPKDLKDSDKLLSFHLKYIDNKMNIERNVDRARRLSENDINMGFNREIHTLAIKEEYYNIYLNMLKESFYLPEYLRIH